MLQKIFVIPITLQGFRRHEIKLSPFDSQLLGQKCGGSRQAIRHNVCLLRKHTLPLDCLILEADSRAI